MNITLYSCCSLSLTSVIALTIYPIRYAHSFVMLSLWSYIISPMLLLSILHLCLSLIFDWNISCDYLISWCLWGFITPYYNHLWQQLFFHISGCWKHSAANMCWHTLHVTVVKHNVAAISLELDSIVGWMLCLFINIYLLECVCEMENRIIYINGFVQGCST